MLDPALAGRLRAVGRGRLTCGSRAEPGNTVAAYASAAAGESYDPTGLKTFMAVATNMRRGGASPVPASGKPSWTGDYAWDPRLTGRAVVNWIRAGFGLPPAKGKAD